jgi:hypothetical protein
MWNKIHTVFSFSTWITGMVLVLWIGYLMVFPLRTVVFDMPGVIEIMGGAYRPGDVIPIRYPFTKYVAIFPEIHRRFINDTVYQLPMLRGSSGIGRHDEWYHNTRIPMELKPGVYRFAIDFVFSINFLREVKIPTLYSDYFEILPAEENSVEKGRKR